MLHCYVYMHIALLYFVIFTYINMSFALLCYVATIIFSPYTLQLHFYCPFWCLSVSTIESVMFYYHLHILQSNIVSVSISLCYFYFYNFFEWCLTSTFGCQQMARWHHYFVISLNQKPQIVFAMNRWQGKNDVFWDLMPCRLVFTDVLEECATFNFRV